VNRLESAAVAAAFVHAGQDLMRGEPAALGVPAWSFAGGFLAYALLLPTAEARGDPLRTALTGGVPLAIGAFHLVATHHGGFFMPVAYAAVLFGAGVVVRAAVPERSAVSVRE
jgi:peptidoglycan/LPS O-acetylase OafA/YrhL